jgi:hypothetical protein
MRCARVSRFIVVAIGFRHQEFVRLREKTAAAGLPIDIRACGHLSEGSNATQEAMIAVPVAHLVLWRPQGAPHLPGGLIPRLPVVRVHGVSSAYDALVCWINKSLAG